jgi:hypothetical protein
LPEAVSIFIEQKLGEVQDKDMVSGKVLNVIKSLFHGCVTLDEITLLRSNILTHLNMLDQIISSTFFTQVVPKLEEAKETEIPSNVDREEQKIDSSQKPSFLNKLFCFGGNKKPEETVVPTI